MSQFFGFDDLKVGQGVKVKGRLQDDGNFAAVEISIREMAEEASIEGCIQSIDHQKDTLRLMDREIAVPGNITIKGLPGNSAGLKGVKAGDMVKLKGKYSAAKGLVPEKIKIKEAMSFNVEELQGSIDKIDREKKTLDVVGVTIMVNERTTIEA